MPSKSNKREEIKSPPGPVRREIKGILFLVTAIILSGSLLSYQPQDPLVWKKAVSLSNAQNLFGSVGAHLAGGLFSLLGFSSFWLVVILVVFAILSFRGRPLSSAVKSMIAAIALPVSFSGILNLQFQNVVSYKNHFMQAGGLVGYYTALRTGDLLNYFGAYVFLVAVFIVSFILISHVSLGQFFSRAGLWVLLILRNISGIINKRKERKNRAIKTMAAKEKNKSRPKVRIIEPRLETPKKPQQQRFPFMDNVGAFKLPPLDLLQDPPEKKNLAIQRESLEMNARRLEKKLEDFGVHGEVQEILPGPVITMYEFKPAPGVKISKVAGLADDLALTLRAPSIRIVAPIPGKAAIGIEIPNNQRDTVYLKEVLSDDSFTSSEFKIPLALGKDITGSPVVTDLTRMPHLLLAGATGTGKSVCINTIINSILYKSPPDMTKLLMVDPKRIELTIYQDIPHLLHPVVTQPKDATKVLKWAVEEMERRYMLLSDRGVRNIDTYNKKTVREAKGDEARGTDKHLPYIVILIDELADLMMVSSKEVEESITRLAQMARAAGIHLILATQRPSVDVLTGIIKANFPTRISFQVSSKVDSRTIIDGIGAEHLLGDGDMLFLPPGVGRLTRIHGAFVSEEEVKAVTGFLRKQKKPDYDTSILSVVDKDEDSEKGGLDHDEKYEEAVEVVLKTGQASISMLQRKLRVGYNRAARMIEVMEIEGLVGPSDGVRPRDVYGRRGA
ncbi:DNA translocase FtsK [uncultured Desulfobacterium sp.]|uniref:DNA translocase FtsK n=1 Tax=uncultured Desulfobacterium sp. TaxID=201089 RepID=A0A445MZI1_9BACT|nr:DNA translocase FtsK [uncultured Desulfobacterium sp.]